MYIIRIFCVFSFEFRAINVNTEQPHCYNLPEFCIDLIYGPNTARVEINAVCTRSLEICTLDLNTAFEDVRNHLEK